MSKMVNAPPHPQAIFVGFEPDDPAFVAMSGLVATAQIVRGLEDIFAMRLREWDLVVIRGEQERLVAAVFPGHMHAFVFGGGGPGMLERGGREGVQYRYDGTQPSPILHVAEGPEISEGFARLVNRELVPWLTWLDARPFLSHRSATHRKPNGVTFVSDADGNPIAGHFVRASGGGRCLVIPMEPKRPELWLAAAIEEWKGLTKDAFADLPSWRGLPQWQTPDERRIVAAIEDVEAERDRVTSELTVRQSNLEADLLAASAAADSGRRRLLTENGKPLVDAVTAALKDLGFDVVDSDALRTEVEPKLEDLIVTDSDAPGWACIAEVKGRPGGGKLGDLIDLGRYATLYLQKQGDLPSSQWYIVNQMRGEDPARRPPMLAGAEEDLVKFGNVGGLAIDTADLWKLLQRVDAGDLTKRDVRELLRTSTRRLAL